MGRQWTFGLFVLPWILSLGLTTGQSGFELCEIGGCNCTNAAGRWITINCTFSNSQKIIIHPGLVPPTVYELSITGGKEIIIQPQSFSQLEAFTLLRFDGTGTLIIQKQAFYNLSSTSLHLQVVGCDKFVLENRSFKNTQTPIRTDIFQCQHVIIEKAAFSRLLEAKFRYISRLDLQEGAFSFEKPDGDITRAVTNVSFYNVTIPKIPPGTFSSSLATVNFVNSHIENIYPEAFKANIIAALKINSSTINRIHPEALHENLLIYMLVLSKANIKILDNRAIMSAVNNFTLEFSSIIEVKSAAFNSTVANALISDNKFGILYSNSFIFKSWNTISIENNVITYARDCFIDAPYNSEVIYFSFVKNEIWNIEDGALRRIPELEARLTNFKFSGNYFNQTCQCFITDALALLVNNTNVQYIFSSTFCIVDAFLSKCFELSEGLINMQNYTQLVCGNETKTMKCERYYGETKLVDSTSTLLIDQDENNSNLILIITLSALLVIAILGTSVILLIRGGLWLKNKGYCIRFKYNANQNSNDDEGAMVRDEPSEKVEYPDELTHELLQELRDQLENPKTREQAREMIERLYEIFVVVDESYPINNNRQEEEAHLYEELGNMQTGLPLQNKTVNETGDGIANFLKLMEDKLNLPLIDDDYNKPPLVNEYSEPTDAAVHLYSELKNKVDEDCDKKNSVKSHSSNGSNMAGRPLPEKPKDEAGPSSKY